MSIGFYSLKPLITRKPALRWIIYFWIFNKFASNKRAFLASRLLGP